MKAVILAGGRGTQLRPITDSRPKSLVNVLNQPLIERVLQSLPPEIDEIFVTADYKAEMLSAFFKKNKKKYPNVTVAKEKRPLGSAGSVKSLEQKLTETFLVVQSDVISSVDMNQLINFHKEQNAVVTLSLFRVENPTDYGIVGLDQDNRIMKFLEKPKNDQVFSTLINAGTYICEPVIFDQIPHYGYCDFSDTVFPRLLRKGDVLKGLEFKGFWMDIGSFDKYLQAHNWLLHRAMTLDVSSKGPARIVPPLLVAKNCKIGKATIGPNVCIAEGVKIAEGCKVYDSVIFEGARIGKNTLVSGSVIGKDVTVGAGAIVMQSIVGDGAKIASKVKIGEESRIWPSKTVKKDLPDMTYFGAPEEFKL